MRALLLCVLLVASCAQERQEPPAVFDMCMTSLKECIRDHEDTLQALKECVAGNKKTTQALGQCIDIMEDTSRQLVEAVGEQ